MAPIKHIRTSTLDIAYEESGQGTPVFLLHGFPYDPRCFDEVARILAAEGLRAIVPYVRGYGPTRFLSAATPRSWAGWTACAVPSSAGSWWQSRPT